MKVILYATITPNGFIARSNYEEDFLPDSGWDAFKKDVTEVGNFIIGRHTYQIIESEHFDSLEALRVVVGSGIDNVRSSFMSAHSPAEALSLLRDKGFDTALVGGGSGLNSSFLSEKLVDEIHFYTVPYLIGKGIPPFSGDIETKLEHISNEPFAEGFIAKYKVIK